MKTTNAYARLMAVFIISMLMFSALPVAFAENENTRNTQQEIRQGQKQALGKARPMLLNADAKETLKEKLRESKEKLAEARNQIRIEAREKINEAREEAGGQIVSECMQICLEELKNSADYAEAGEEKLGLLCNQKCVKPLNSIKADNTQIAKAAKARAEKLKEIIAELKPIKITPARLIEQPELVKMDKALARAKEKYGEAKQKHVDSRKTLEELKADYKRCIKEKRPAITAEGQPAASECDEIKKKFTAESRTFLVETAELLVEALNKIKYQAQISGDISEEDAAAMDASLEAEIIRIKNVKAEIEKLDENSSPQEFEKYAKIIAESWKKVRTESKEKVGKLMGAKLGNMIHRMEQLKEKFTNARDKLKEKGADVSALDDYLQSYDAYLQAAKDNYNDAVGLFNSAEGSSDASGSKVKEAHELLKKARETLSDAKKELMKVLREIKKQLAGLNKENEGNAEESGTTEEAKSEEQFKYAYWQCHNSEEQKQGSESSCKSSETWQGYAEEFCQDKCNEDGSKCGVNSFSLTEECYPGSESLSIAAGDAPEIAVI